MTTETCGGPPVVLRTWCRTPCLPVLVCLAASLVLPASQVCAAAAAEGQPPASSPRLAFVYGGGESTGPVEVRRAVEPLGIDVTVYAPGRGGDQLTADAPLHGYDVLFVDGRTAGIGQHAVQVAAARAVGPVVVVHPSAGITGNVSLTDHPDIETYWAQPSQDNYAGLAVYLATRVATTSGQWAARRAPPPVVYPAQGFYHPEAPRLFTSLQEYEAWAAAAVPAAGGEALVVGATFNLTSYLQKNLAHVDAVIRTVESRGHRALVLAYRGMPDVTAFQRDEVTVIDVLVQMGSVFVARDREAALEQWHGLGVPVLSALHLSSQDEAHYRASPTGLLPTQGTAVVDAERDGRIEPMAVSGRGAERGDQHFAVAFEPSVAWRVDRALAWARLHRASNADKRVIFTYWSQGGGKANVGGDPDDFLDVPATLVRLLHGLRDRGYDVGTDPLPDRDTLTRRMALEGSNIGSWAEGELAARVARGELALVSEAQYLEWFHTLPEVRRDEIVEMWGPPPGRVMVHTDASGDRHLAIPALFFGKVALVPNPDWGYLQDERVLMSTGTLPPHHQYVAAFKWMQHAWRADAWVSLFSNMSLQPGKPVGPLPDDHIGLLLGHMPHIHPERLGSNGGLKNRRKVLAQLAGWYSHVRPSGTSSQYFPLRALLQRHAGVQDDELRGEGERLLRAEVTRTGLDRAIDGDVEGMTIDQLAARVQRELDVIDRMRVPAGSKVLGTAPEGDTLIDMVTAMLSPDLVHALAAHDADPRTLARALVAEALDPDSSSSVAPASSPDGGAVTAEARSHAAALATAPREVEAVFEALEGRWIAPGPMDDPIRKPDALPPGRSLYDFDVAEIPTPEAEALGRRQAEALIEKHRQAHDGAWPTSLAFAIFSGEIAKNRGVTEAQILHLLGTRVVRDTRGLVTGVQLIPREELGRPRVDVMVTTSGTFRDHYPTVLELFAEATQLAAGSGEADNPVRAGVQAAETTLRQAGEDADRAGALARARVFAPAPGAYSPSIQFLARAGDQRGDQAKMAELYISRLSHAYGGGLYGEAARPAFERQLARVDGASMSRSDDVNGMLDHPMTAGFLGGLNLAAQAVTGSAIDLYVSNLRDPANASIESAAGEIQRELRTRYFNPSWVAQMQEHGYEGARTFMYLTDHLDLWDTTATQTVSSADWDEVKAVYVDDTFGLNMDAFFERHNPHAQQVVLANLLGAASRGHWDGTPEERRQVAARLAASASTHGIVCEASVCRNPALTRLVVESLEGRADATELADGYRAAIRAATVPAAVDLTDARDATPRAVAAVETPPLGMPFAGTRAPVPAPTAAVSVSAPAPSPPPPAASAATSSVAPVVTGRVLETVTTPGSMSGSYAGAPARWPWFAALTFGLVVLGWTTRPGG